MKRKRTEEEKIRYINNNLNKILETDIKNMYKHGIIPVDTMYRKLRLLQYNEDLEKYKKGEIKCKPLLNEIADEMGKSKAYISKYIGNNEINITYKMYFQEWLLSKGEDIVSYFETNIQDCFFEKICDLMYDISINEYEIDKKITPGTAENYWSNLMSGRVIKDKIIGDNRDEVVISFDVSCNSFIIEGGRTDTETGSHRKIKKLLNKKEGFINDIFCALKNIYRVEDTYFINKTGFASLTYCIMLLSYVDICKKSSRFINQ